MPIFRPLRTTASDMPAALDKFLTALSGALALFGLLLISALFFPSPDNPHGGMFVAAFGVWIVLPIVITVIVVGAFLFLSDPGDGSDGFVYKIK